MHLDVAPSRVISVTHKLSSQSRLRLSLNQLNITFSGLMVHKNVSPLCFCWWFFCWDVLWIYLHTVQIHKFLGAGGSRDIFLLPKVDVPLLVGMFLPCSLHLVSSVCTILLSVFLSVCRLLSCLSVCMSLFLSLPVFPPVCLSFCLLICQIFKFFI